MGRVWIAADLHLGHRSIYKYRDFPTAEEHHETVWDTLCATVGKRDTILLLGDICFTEEWAKKLGGLACNKILIMGNHDHAYLGCYNRVEALLSYKGCWLSHCPIHPDELEEGRRLYNIHGHLHGGFINDPRYFNVGLEHTDMTPVLFADVIAQLKERN